MDLDDSDDDKPRPWWHARPIMFLILGVWVIVGILSYWWHEQRYEKQRQAIDASFERSDRLYFNNPP